MSIRCGAKSSGVMNGAPVGRWRTACVPRLSTNISVRSTSSLPARPLRAQIESGRLSSIILWGPPGSGKTTLARLIAQNTRASFVPFSAVLSGIKEIKAVMADAERASRSGLETVLFIDEIHRFNKAQQDAFLPYVEHGDMVLIGATTENPSFEVVSALLSRTKVYSLRALETAEIVSLAAPRPRNSRSEGWAISNSQFPIELLEEIAAASNGDARAAFNTLEVASSSWRRKECRPGRR